MAVALWPDEPVEQPAELEQVSALGAPFRTAAPLSRGSVDRSAAGQSTPSTSATATPQPTETPEPTPTPTPEPEPTPEPTPEPVPVPEVVDEMYVTAALNVRTGPSANHDVVAVLPYGSTVGVTGNTDGPWVQIVHDGQAAWVNGAYLSESEPGPEISYAECPDGTEVESGLTPDAIRVYRAVCAQFPEVSSWGGLRGGGGEHSTGHALDIMVSNSSLGDAIAAWVREHYQELGVSEVIWAQQIWTVQRAGDGWRWMEDRGSITANHYDHVHVTVYGDAGG
jgi:hypothetical protein